MDRHGNFGLEAVDEEELEQVTGGVGVEREMKESGGKGGNRRHQHRHG